MQAKIKKINDQQTFPTFFIALSTDNGENLWVNKRHNDDFTFSSGGYGRVYSHRPYSSSRRLKRYRMGVNFYGADDNTPGEAYAYNKEITCHY